MSTLAKYPRATAITIYSLSIFLGLIHLFFGLVAITPKLSHDYHRETKINYNAFAKALSFLHDLVDRATLALYLRYLIAAVQVSCGALLIESSFFLGPHFVKFANYGLIFIDVSYLLFQLGVKSSYERIAPTIVFLVLLVTRMLIVQQSSKKSKVGVKTRNAGKPKTSTPKKNKNE